MIFNLDRLSIRSVRVPLALMASVAFTGCVSLLPNPVAADLIYRLVTVSDSLPSEINAPVVRIDRPTVSGALRGKDIVLYGQATQVTRASGAVWSDDIPTLIQHSLFDVIAGNPTLTGVLPNSGARPTYRVSMNVRRFEANFDQGKSDAPIVVSHYSAVISDGASRKLISTFDVKREQRANSISVTSIVEAQSLANQQALEAISQWIDTSLKSYDARGKS